MSTVRETRVSVSDSFGETVYTARPQSDLQELAVYYGAPDVLDLLDQLTALFIGVKKCRARFGKTVSTARPPSDLSKRLRVVDNRLYVVDVLMKNIVFNISMLRWNAVHIANHYTHFLLLVKKLLLDAKKLLLVGFCTLPPRYAKKLLLDVKKLLLVGFCTLPPLDVKKLLFDVNKLLLVRFCTFPLLSDFILPFKIPALDPELGIVSDHGIERPLLHRNDAPDRLPANRNQNLPKFDALKRLGGKAAWLPLCILNSHPLITSAAFKLASYLLVQPTWLLRFVQWRNPSVFFLKSTTEPFVALTIDDAPHVNITPEILKILEEFRCKATFFAIGENLDKNPGLFEHICEKGHEVANHTMRDFPSWRLSREELRKELSETDRRIRPQNFSKDPATKKDLKWFRPGHGFFNEGMIAEAEAQGYRVALGSIYPWDTLFTAQGSLLSQSILRRIHPGAVIVLHDREPQKEQTLQILRTILPELKAKGYHVVTLSHLHSLTSPPVTISSSSESDIVMKTGTQRWSWCQRVSMNVVMDTVKETFTRWWSRFQRVSMTVVMGNGDSKRDIYSKVV